MRSRIAGEIEMHSREIDRLRAELVHLDATMQLFDPETDPTDVPALRRYPRRTEWFARGEVTQRVYEAFREQEVIWPREITLMVWTPPDGIDVGTAARLGVRVQEGTFRLVDR